MTNSLNASAIQHSTRSDRPDPMATVLVEKLHELGQVIDGLSDEQYRQNPVGQIPSSVGGHVRHALDHVRALIESITTGRLDFDARVRGTPVEKERRAALEMIDRLAHSLMAFPTDRLNANIELSMMVRADLPPVQVASNLRRETGYVLSHMIHHNAIISAMVATLGGTLPAGFGFAPATIEFQGRKSQAAPTTCAQ